VRRSFNLITNDRSAIHAVRMTIGADYGPLIENLIAILIIEI